MPIGVAQRLRLSSSSSRLLGARLAWASWPNPKANNQNSRKPASKFHLGLLRKGWREAAQLSVQSNSGRDGMKPSTVLFSWPGRSSDRSKGSGACSFCCCFFLEAVSTASGKRTSRSSTFKTILLGNCGDGLLVRDRDGDVLTESPSKSLLLFDRRASSATALSNCAAATFQGMGGCSSLLLDSPPCSHAASRARLPPRSGS